MAAPSHLLSLFLGLLAGSLVAEATYYRPHRYFPHYIRFRQLPSNMENQIPEVVNPPPRAAAPHPGVPRHPIIPHVLHPRPEDIQSLPEVFHRQPEVAHPAPESYHRAAPPALPAPRVFHGIMFDAGSTGTRIHIYKFIQKDPVELPVLDNEMYHAVKPGLSAYKDNPEEGGNTVRQLLKIAKKTVPEEEWKRTPVVLKATAGLRLLPEDKANALLNEVRHVFEESPFYVPSNSVTIMNGTNEGVLAWVTVNFLTGHLYSNTKRTVGILDLGGGSTQITFLPKSKKTVQSAPHSYIAKFNLFNSTYQLYTHSYLGNGLYAARLATLGALGADGLEWKVFTSSCLPKKFREDVTFGGTTYHVSGVPDGYAGYKLCYYEVMKVIKGIVHQPYEVKGSSVFYAFSYYFDRAVESGLIDSNRGGAIEVRDFKKRAKEVCNKMTKYRAISPFLCMDMTYITCLLKEGFGFKDNTVLQLAKKVNNVETSWALGATFDYFRNLNIH
ncbi:ectonucleoside triphosphate diphosphohydrolase 5 [Corythoichthys intestinalis]|uniref:ectonucleoside triphosphate diphosphohydrolase 5 n=1 Tax=Corythoichthys intestinalis TaxID=161448 RepID=UPI0025A594B9|nr:ectonucleoside triphosphate diphosphohydrolase 5 [Corythoichthys intestinalis]XP_061798482.1 ectonucleoside triphosphate diphosphohydrolase 5-like [Nerophis lumbriciformis]